MFYADWLKCPGGSYMNLTITNLSTNEKLEIYGDLYQVPVNFSFSKDYTYTEVPVRDAMLSKFNDVFNPIQFSISGRPSLSLPLIKKILRDKRALYRLDIKDSYVIFRISSDVSNLNTSSQNESIEFSITTVSNFIKEKVFTYEIDEGGGIITGGFPYEFPRPLSGYEGNRYEEGKIELYCEGDTDAYFNVEILGESTNPGFSLEDNPLNTTKSYLSKDVTIDEGEYLSVNSFPLSTGINKGSVNYEQYRYFKGHDTYLTLPNYIVNTLYFKNVRKAEVTVYEQYYNLP